MAKYSDLNLNFKKHPNTRDVLKHFDVQAVRSAVLNLINTNHGEKLFKPNFGGNLRAMLFEPNLMANKELLTRQWNEMLKLYEPRAVIDELEVVTENNELYITLQLSLRQTPDVKFSLPIRVQRIR